MRDRTFTRFLAAIVILLGGGLAHPGLLAQSFSKAFSPSTVGPGAESRLTFTITAGSTNLTDLAFTDTLPAGLTVSSTPSLASTCSDSSVTATGGSSSITLTDGRLTANATCTIAVNVVTTATPGALNNVSGDLTSSAGNLGTAAATLTVDNARPGFTKVFSPDSISLGASSVVTFTLDNSANFGIVPGANFTDSLPTGLVVASPSNASTTCASGTVTATPNSASISFSGILFASTSCTVTATVRATSTGVKSNTTILNVSGTPSGQASDSLTVTAVGNDNIQATKEFTNDPIGPGEIATLRLSLTNTSRDFTASNLAISDDLNAMLAGSTGALVSNTCGGTVTGGGTVSLSGGSLASGATCQIVLNVQIPASATGGTYPNTTTAATATINGSTVTGNQASDSLNLLDVRPPVLTKSFTPSTVNPGQSTTINFQITNPNTGDDLDNPSFQDDLSAFLEGVTVTSLPPANSCGTGSTFISSIVNGSTILTAQGGTLPPGGSCSFSVTISTPGGAPAGPHTNTTTTITAVNDGTTVTGLAASADLTINGSASVTFSKSFGSSNVAQGGTVPLTFQISSSGDSNAVTDLAFTDAVGTAAAPGPGFISGATVESIDSNTCNGTTSGTGTGTFTLAGGSLPGGGASCAITITVRLPGAVATNTYTNTTSDLSFTAGGAVTQPGASASISVLQFRPPVFTKQFLRDTLVPGEQVTLRFSIDATNVGGTVTNMAFSDQLSSVLTGMVFVNPLPATPCGTGSALSLSSLDRTLTLSGGGLAAGASCTFDVTTQIPSSASAGTYINNTSSPIGLVDGSAFSTDAANDSFTVTNDPLLFSKSFSADTVAPGGSLQLAFTITNPSTVGYTATEIGFTDDLSGMFLTATGLPSNNFCGTGSTLTGTTTLTASNLTLASGQSCTFNVTLGVDSGATPGGYTNTTTPLAYKIQPAGAASGIAFASNSATDTLTISNPVAPVLTKAFDAPTGAGRTAKLTFTITNPDGEGIGDLAFTDDLNAMLAGATATGLPGTPCGAGSSITGSSSLVFAGGTVSASGSCTFEVTVNVPGAATPGTYTNTTSSLQRQGLTVGAPATATLTIEPAPVLTKSFAPTTVETAQTSTLTLTINNSGATTAASSLTLTDNLPAGLEVAATPNASTTCTGGTLSATAGTTAVTYVGGSVAGGATCTVTLDILATTAGSKTNSADLTSSLGNSAQANAVLTVIALQPLPLSKSFSVSSVAQGEPLSMTLTFSNPNTLTNATSVAVTDTLPTGLIVTGSATSSAGCSAGTVTANASLVTFAGSLAPGNTCTVTVPVQVNEQVTSLTNTASLSSSVNATTAQASATLGVTPANPPAFNKTISPATVDVQQPATLTLSLANTSAFVTAGSISVNDPLPTGMVLAGTPAVSGSGCTGSAGGTSGGSSLTFTGSLAPLGTCQITVQVLGQTAGNLTNTATYTSDLNASPISAAAGLTVNAPAGPVITKVFSGGSTPQGSPLSMTITLNNPNAFASITNVDMTDPLPAGLEISTPAAADSACSGGTLNGAPDERSVSFTGSTLAPGQTCTITVGVTATASGNLSNTASVVSAFNATPNTATAFLSVSPPGAPLLSKAFSTNTAVEGETLAMVLTVSNVDPFVPATDITLTDTFPAGLVVASPPSGDAGCTSGTASGTIGGTSVTLTGGRVEPNSTCTITVGVTVTGSSDIVNTASMTSSLNATAVQAQAAIAVTPAAGPTLTKAFSTNSAVQGETLTMVLTIGNGNAILPATDVTLTDTFPAGLVVASPPSGDAGCTSGTASGAIGGTSVTLTGGRVEPNSTCTITVGVTVTGSADLVNTASMTSSLNATAVQAQAAIAVTPATVPTLIKAFSADTARQGDTLQMTLTVQNDNPRLPLTDITLTDTFPSGLVIASAPSGGTGCSSGTATGDIGGTSVNLTGGRVEPNSTCTITVGVTVTGSSDIVNTAFMTSSSNATPIRGQATLTVLSGPVPTLTKSFSSDAAQQGETLTMTLAIRNGSDFVAVGDITVNDTFPDGLVIATAPGGDAGCSSGAATGEIGGSRVTLTGGRVEPNTTCTITVGVTVTGSSDIVNTASMTSQYNATPIESRASLSVIPATGPTLSKAFSVAATDIAQPLTMTLVLQNPNAFVEITGIALADPFPNGLEVASAPVGDAGCVGGSFSGTTGDTSVSYTQGTVAAGTACTVTVGVVATAAGALTNTASVTSDYNTTATEASATLQVSSIEPPQLAKSFSVDSVIQGEALTMTLAITNPNSGIVLTNVTLTDSFPSGLVISTPAAKDDTCSGGALTGATGGTAVTYTGGTVAPNGVCTITVGVTVPGNASLTNTASLLSDQNTPAIEASASLNVNPAPSPDFAKVFEPATIFQFETTRLRFVIDNGEALVEAGALGFSDTFDPSITVAPTPNASTTCPGGTLTANAGENSIRLAGATLPAGESCQVSVNVTADAVGIYDSTSDTLTSTLGNSGTASARLTVRRIVTGELTIIQQADPDGVFAFSSAANALNFQIQTVNGSGSVGPIRLQEGEYEISQVLPQGFGNLGVTCSDDNSVGDALGQKVTIRLEAQETLTCTFTSLQTDQRTIDVINRFLMRRADFILASEPDLGRRIDRLNRGFGNASQVSFANGDLVSMLPFKFDPLGIRADNIEVTGSFAHFRETAAKVELAHGATEKTKYVSNYRWDAWFEAKYKKFDDSDGSGDFAIAYFGADYLMNDNLLLGVVLQIDRLEETNTNPISDAEGTGWMAGPYMTARLSPNLYFDARVAAGKSTNSISPFGAGVYTDEFETDRWLAMMNLTGEFTRGAWKIRPNASLAYYSEKQAAYVDSLGVPIPSQTIQMGQVKLGPTFAGNFEGSDGVRYEPTFSIEAIYNMGQTLGVTPTNPTPISEGWRGRAQAGIALTTENGTRFKVGGTYDGLFRSDYEAIGVTFDITIPLAIAKAR